MLETLISNKTRIKLLLRFFLNPEMRAYLRGLGREFGESSNAVRIELNRFENAGLILSEKEGNRKYYRANEEYPLFRDLQQIAMKHFGLDQVVEKVVRKLGEVKKVYLIGNMAKGQDAPIIDLVIISQNLDRVYLTELTEKAEKKVGRKIRCLVLDTDETDVLSGPKVLIYEE